MKQQLPASMTELIEYARLAPSVHNTQPWKFHIEGLAISLFVAEERTLTAGDPTHRELWISLGACLESLLYAAKGLGFSADIRNLQTESVTSEIASIELTPSLARDQVLLDLLKKRHSYRGPMVPTTIQPSLLKACRRSIADFSNTSVHLMTEKSSINQVAEFTYRGLLFALSIPVFRKELAEHIHTNWSAAKTGLHGFALNLGVMKSMWEKWSIALGLGLKQKAQADKQRVLDATGLLFIASKGDVPQFWFEAGRAYIRTAIEVTRAGFVQSTITAPVEAGDLHENIEKLVQTTNRIQTMTRIGKPDRPVTSTTSFSPRLSVEELLT